MTDRRASVRKCKPAAPDNASPERCRPSSSSPTARYVWESCQAPSWREPGGGESAEVDRGEARREPERARRYASEVTPEGLAASVSHEHLEGTERRLC
jgi:hypothetical protein